MTTCDDQVKAYIKKIMSQLSKWMQKSKISKLVIVITDKETGEHVERWQFDVRDLWYSDRLRTLTICQGQCLLRPIQGLQDRQRWDNRQGEQ